jgi:hypothetical protein
METVVVPFLAAATTAAPTCAGAARVGVTQVPAREQPAAGPILVFTPSRQFDCRPTANGWVECLDGAAERV